jgi:Do/DeqQ family serine protease
MDRFMQKILIVMLSLLLCQQPAFGFKIFGGDNSKDQSPSSSTKQSEEKLTPGVDATPIISKTNKPVKLSFADAVERAEPAVVSIQTTKEMPMELHPLLQDPFFRFFFNDPNGNNQQPGKGGNNEIPKQVQQGLGSGVIINKKGYVLTNNHVIKDAKSISVKLTDGRTSDAKVIGSDAKTDLAVLKLNNLKDLPEITLGSSANLRVGDVVLAIGNPFGFERTVTLGIVSANGSLRQRVANDTVEGFGAMLDNLIQTDAAINPGNSGGALIDSEGNLIGINMAIITNKYDAHSTGIGFAIPIDLAKTVMQQLIDTGYIVRGWLGAYLGDITDEIKKYLNYKEKSGVYVRGIFRNSPAERAGLLSGDIIVKINGQEVKNVTEAINIVSNLSPNKGYPFEICRKGEFVTFSVVIAERPKDSE